MDRSHAIRRVGSKSSKKESRASSNSSSNNASVGSGSSNYNKGGNPVCQRETPEWQKPITTFFKKAEAEKENSGFENQAPTSKDAGRIEEATTSTH